MFQNIEGIQGSINYKEKERKLNIFSNVLTKNNIILYILVFMVSTIGVGQTFSPFSLAITVACISVGIPIMGVALCAIAGNLVAFGTGGVLNYMVLLLVTIITMFIAKPVYNDENRNEKLKISKNLFFSVFVVQCFKLMLVRFTIYECLMVVTISLVTVIFYKIFVNSVVVVQEFTERSAFSIEEVMGASLLLAIAFSALGDFDILGFSIRNILCILIVLVLGWKNGMLVGTTAGVTIGVTLGVISGAEPMMIAAYAVSGLLAGVLNRFGRIGVVVGFVVGSGVLAFISNGGTSSLILFKEILVASLGLLAMPKSVSINIEEFMGGSKMLPVSPFGALMRSKEKETASKLEEVSSALQDIANTYGEMAEDAEAMASNRNIFVSELLNQMDGKEKNLLYEDITKMENPITDELFSILVKKQEITRKDLLETFAKFNSYIVGSDDDSIGSGLRTDIDEVVTCVNNAYKISKSNFVLHKKLSENKKTMSTQLGEVSKAISNLAEDIKKDIKSESTFEEQKREIIALASGANIELEDVRINQASNGRMLVDVFATKPLSSSKQTRMCKIVSNVLGERMVVSGSFGEGELSLVSEDKFFISVGSAGATKKGSDMSGDNILKTRLKDGKYLIAISDGMGSGEDAYKSSHLALGMLQKLLSSGFDKDTSVELINSALLNASQKEIYATLDIAIVDLYTGNVEFIKSGACPTYIKNRKRINLVKSLSLPTGIVNNVQLSLYDKDIESGDVFVMCSDGILDSNVEYKNKELWVKYLLEDMDTDDAQKIADLILNEAIDNNFGTIKDDMSIIVCKFTSK